MLMHHMTRATVRDLRYDFPKVERALRAGNEVQITKRRRVIARLIPEGNRTQRPDFAARLRNIYGDKCLEVSAAELISSERNGR